MLALALAALMFGVLMFGTALTHNAGQIAKSKNLPETPATPESMRAHDSIGAAAIVVIILLILALSR